MYRPALIAGTIFGATSVMLGAFGAHGLREIATPDVIESFRTGATYQMYSAFFLLAAGMLYTAFPVRAVRVATWTAVAGVLLFSGSLYAMTGARINGDAGLVKSIGPVTPIGGIFFVIAWIALLTAVLRKK